MNVNPELPKFLSLEDELAVFAPRVEVRLEQAVEMICEVIVFCRERGINALLIDARELYGFSQPSVVDRYWFARKWASETEGEVVLSFIQRPEMIDPERIGTTIAANAGLIANVFENEGDARAWLTSNVHMPTRI